MHSLRQSTIALEIILETVLVSVQDMCTVCVECTIGSEIILDTHDGTAR
jgi:hypothetical protein